MAFKIGLAGGLSHTTGGNRRMARGFRRAGLIKPPAGTYDPGLDAGVRAAGRGYNDLTQDLERDGERASTGFLQGKARLGEDNAFQSGGLDVAEQRLREDYGQQTETLGRNFRQLGVNQGGALAMSGLGGGAFAAAAARRGENQGREQVQLDQSRDRGLGDISRERGRLATLFARGTEDLGTDFQYGQDDRATAGARAGRENTFYGQDVSDQRFFQAGQAGWTPPGAAKPKPKTYGGWPDGKRHSRPYRGR